MLFEGGRNALRPRRRPASPCTGCGGCKGAVNKERYDSPSGNLESASLLLVQLARQECLPQMLAGVLDGVQEPPGAGMGASRPSMVSC